MVGHYDQDERERDGSHHRDTAKSVLLKAFGKYGMEHKNSQKDLSQVIQEGSRMKRVELERVSLSEVVRGMIYLWEWNDSGWKGLRQSTTSNISLASEILLLRNQMKNPVMITRFFRKCIITVIGNVIRMPFVG